MSNSQNVIYRDMYQKLDDEGKVIKKSPEQKQYLLLLTEYQNSENRTYEIITGRSNVIDYLASNELEDIDLRASLILVEGLPLEKAQQLLVFINYCLDNEFVEDENAYRYLAEEASKYDDEEEYDEDEPQAPVQQIGIFQGDYNHEEV